jgi:hypothetical protein
MLDGVLERQDPSAFNHFVRTRSAIQQVFSFATAPRVDEMQFLLDLARTLHGAVSDGVAKVSPNGPRERQSGERAIAAGWSALAVLLSGLQRTWSLEVYHVKPGDTISRELARCASLRFRGAHPEAPEGRRVISSQGIAVARADGTIVSLADVFLEAIGVDNPG